MGSKRGSKRERGEWGIITDIDEAKFGKGKDKFVQVKWAGGKLEDYTNCNIIAFEKVESTDRRRLSPGEKFLHTLRLARPYHDPPVLTRLLKEVREGNNQ